MRQRSTFRNWIEYWLARGLLAVLAMLPFRVAFAIARGVFRVVDLLQPKLRQTAFRNLGLAYPGLSVQKQQDLVNDLYRSLARALGVFARLPQINHTNISHWIRYEGYEHFERAKAAGKGVLFLTAHLGNWELSAYAHALLSEPMAVVVRPLDNPYLDSFVTNMRCGSGNQVIGRGDFSRSILRALHRNQAVGILLDQNVAEGLGIFVDFFGVPASTNPTFARIAARSGAAVIPGFAVWSDAENRYVLRFYPPLEITGDLTADTACLQSAVEKAIREYPGQWLWLHRRWKTRPSGEASLY